jgi:hypothetical protein
MGLEGATVAAKGVIVITGVIVIERVGVMVFIRLPGSVVHPVKIASIRTLIIKTRIIRPLILARRQA